MPKWEYMKMDLNTLTAKSDDLDLLNDAGLYRWELVVLTPNNIAYMKRSLDKATSTGEDTATPERRKSATPPPAR
jgi:hypothetical protein